MTSSRPDEPRRVSSYFDEHAVDFDTIYVEAKSPLRQLRDRLTRGTVVGRLELVDRLARAHQPSRVLDIGCGSGRFAVRLAQQGAEVVGLDFAEQMLVLARQAAQQAGVGDRCRFVNADFLEWEADGAFDLGLAIGFFDYVADPAPMLEKLARLCGNRVVASFPKRFDPLVPPRYVRLRLSGCPVHFYSRRQVEELARAAVGPHRIEPLGRDYILLGGL